MSKRDLLFEGSSKTLLDGPEPGSLILHFKDTLTFNNNKKSGTVVGKGVLNNRISGFLMERLNDMGVETHFIRNSNMREQIIQEAAVLPLKVVVRNLSAGNIVKSFGIEEGYIFPVPLVEFRIKAKDLKDPMASPDHLKWLVGIPEADQETIRSLALRANDILSGVFFGIGMRLVDIEFEVGRIYDEEMGRIEYLIIDEITPDTCRLWDLNSGEKMSIDRSKEPSTKHEKTYQEVARRLGVL